MAVGYLVVGGVFVLYGLWVYHNQYGRIGVGGGRAGGLPLFTVEVRGFVAKLCGVILILGGSLFASGILEYVQKDYQTSFLAWLPALGIGITIIGMFFCVIMQSAISGGEKLKAFQDKSKAHNHSVDTEP